MRRRLPRVLVLAVLAVAWVSAAAAAPRERGVTLHWTGTAWVEVPPDHPTLREPVAAEGREVTLYWNGAAWVELPPGLELRYSHLTGSSREVDAHDASPERTSSESSAADERGAARSWLAPHPPAPSASGPPARAGMAGSTSWNDGGPTGPAAAEVAVGTGGAVAAGAAVAGAGVTTTEAAPGAAPPPTPAVSAAEQSTSASISLIGDLHDGLTRTGGSFQLASLRDLRILVDWARLPGAANVQRVEVLGPDGNLYQTFTTPIAATQMATRLPVGGTWITQHGLAGAWRVQVYLNKDASPVATQDFQLRR